MERGFGHTEELPFILRDYSQKGKIVFISQSHSFLDELSHNLSFLGVNSLILSPRFSFFTNHEGLNDFTFLKNYVQSFENQAKVTLMHSSFLFFPMPEPDSFSRISLSKGQKVSITDIAKNLVSMGYISTSTVYNPAEFAMRGYILDFATTSEAIRIEFSGNQIEEIKKFDCETQKSIEILKQIEVFPNKLIQNVDLPLFKARYKMQFQEENAQLFHAVENHPESCDVNKYSKMIVKNTMNIMEILSGSIYLHNFTTENLVQTMNKEFDSFAKQIGIGAEAFYYTNPSSFLEKATVIACV